MFWLVGAARNSLANLIYYVMSASKRQWSFWIASALITKFFVGLGLSLVTYKGLSTLSDYFFNSAVSILNGLPADLLSLLQLAGLSEALGIVGGAWTLRTTLVAGRVFISKGLPSLPGG